MSGRVLAGVAFSRSQGPRGEPFRFVSESVKSDIDTLQLGLAYF